MGLHLPIMLIPEYLLDTAALPLLQYMIIFRVVQQSMAHSTVLGIILLGCFLDLFLYFNGHQFFAFYWNCYCRGLIIIKIAVYLIHKCQINYLSNAIWILILAVLKCINYVFKFFILVRWCSCSFI